MTPKPETKTAVSFLRKVHPNRPWAITSILDGAISTHSFGKNERGAATKFIERHNGKSNLYWSVATVKPQNKKAKLEDVETVHYLHVDIDPKDGQDLTQERDRIRHILNSGLPEGVPAPTFVIDSGGGFQGFWKLTNPIKIDGDTAKAETAGAYNKRLEEVLGGDHCHNVDRIMRLPGTVNIPDERKKKKGRVRALARIVAADWDRKYPIKKFKSADLGSSKAGESLDSPDKPTIAVIDIPVSERIRDLIAGIDDPAHPYRSRSERVFACIMAMATAGCTDETIMAVIAENPIGDHVREQSQPDRYLAKQIARAREASQSAVSDYIAPPPPKPMPIMGQEAFDGLAGDIVRAIKDESEADPNALLVSALVAIGNVIGREIFYQVEATRHHPNLFATLVGKSAKSRKGTSWDRIREIMGHADEPWANTKIRSGFASGEAIIWDLRDPKSDDDIVIEDKRMLLLEPEFAKLLRTAAREGSILSPVIRDAWDGRKLSNLSKGSPAVATGAHISCIAHVTAQELTRYLDSTEISNGFANRFLFVPAARSQMLPLGGRIDPSVIETLAKRVKAVVDHCKDRGEVGWSQKGRKLWFDVYAKLSADRPGLLGTITARAEALVVRLALLYAVLDLKGRIEASHLRSALALWNFCEASAKHIFGESLGDPIADAVLNAIELAGADGITRTELTIQYGKHPAAGAKLNRALNLLAEQKLVTAERTQTGGRPVERWRRCP